MDQDQDIELELDRLRKENTELKTHLHAWEYAHYMGWIMPAKNIHNEWFTFSTTCRTLFMTPNSKGFWEHQCEVGYVSSETEKERRKSEFRITAAAAAAVNKAFVDAEESRRYEA